jgi:hypothetical protein
MSSDRLGPLVATWKENGALHQEPINWEPAKSNWLRDLPHLVDFIENLPILLDRRSIREIFESEFHATEAKFATVMIWGYGVVGYGSFRTKKMFGSSDFLAKVEESYRLSRSGHFLDAYRFLSKNRIEWLGPAFATKWISFASPTSNPAPIYDSFVSKWFGHVVPDVFGPISSSSLPWNLKTYATYVNWMQEQAGLLNVNIGDLELLIFQDAMRTFPNSSKWKTL